MTSNERLEQKFIDICELLRDFEADFKRVNKSKGKRKKGDAAYHDWVNTFEFGDKSDPSNQGDISLKRAHLIMAIRRGLDRLEADDSEVVRVVKYYPDKVEPYVDYLSGEHFEASKDSYEICPDCGGWVKKNIPSCTCGKQFGETKELIYCGPMGVQQERFIRDGDKIRHEMVVGSRIDGKMVLGTKAYIAEYQVVEGDAAKQLLDSMSAPTMQHDAFVSLYPPMVSMGHKVSQSYLSELYLEDLRKEMTPFDG